MKKKAAKSKKRLAAGSKPSGIKKTKKTASRPCASRRTLPEEISSAIFECGIDGIFVIDRKGRYRDVNPAACRMSGFTADEFLGSEMSIQLFPEDVTKAFEDLESVFNAKDGRFFQEYRLRRKDGSEMWAECAARPVKAGAEDLVCVIIRDITARRRASELVKANQLLRKEVKKRLKPQDVLNSIFLNPSCASGEEPLCCLLENLSSALKFKHIFIDRLCPGGVCHSLMICPDGGTRDFERPVKGTPFEKVYGEKPRWYGKGIRKLFPADALLCELKAESYVGVPLFSSKGNPLGVLAAMDDKPMAKDAGTVSMLEIFGARAAMEVERKQVEDELRKKADMLNGIIDNTTAVIFLKDADGRYLLVNRWYEILFNTTKENVRGKTDYDIFPREMADVLVAHDRKVAAENLPCEFEETVVHHDQSLHTYLVIKFPVAGLSGAVCGIATDITERKRTSEELINSERRLKEAQRIARLGSWEVDTEGGNAYWSEEVLKILGADPRKEKGGFQYFLDLVHTEDRLLAARRYMEVLDGKPLSEEFRVVGGDGRTRVVKLEGRAELDRNGKPLKVTGTMQDITEQKKMEGELLNAQKLESIGVLAGGIAHEFNNLLLGVLGNISVVKSRMSQSDRMYSILDDAERAALRSKSLTRRLLTFSRGDGPVRESAPVEQLVRDTACLVLGDSNIEKEFSFQKGLWEAIMDEAQIMQVINNLVLNAQQAMPGGGVLNISAENVTVGNGDGVPLERGDYVKITIKDRGAGIPKDVLPKIFDPFFTTKKKASGLGLAVSYSIVKKHGGAILVESEEGKGAVFRIYLPADRQHASVKTDSLISGKGRVLVMDDEKVVRDTTREMLCLLGYEAVTTANGEEALEAFKNAKASGAPFDAAILDLTVMCGAGGKETIERIREIDPGFKAIVSSGYSKDAIMSEFRELGFAGVIAKPYSVSEFSRVLSGVIRGSGGPAR